MQRYIHEGLFLAVAAAAMSSCFSLAKADSSGEPEEALTYPYEETARQFACAAVWEGILDDWEEQGGWVSILGDTPESHQLIWLKY